MPLEHISQLPPLHALEAVIVAAREGSFSNAAAVLGITHGAVSRRVAVVETWAGYRVFERHGRGVRPTTAGHALLAQIERAIAVLDDSRGVGGRSDMLEIVRVGVVPSFARMWLLPNMAALEGMPADLRIEPDVDNRFMTLSDQRVAIRYGAGDWPGVASQPLFAECFVPVAHPSIAAALDGSDDPQRLLEWPLLHDATAADWINWLGRAGVYYEPRHIDRTFTAYDLTLLAASVGLGVALLRDPYGRQLAGSYGLVPVSSQRLSNPKRFHLLTATSRLRPSVARLAERMLAVAANDVVSPS